MKRSLPLALAAFALGAACSSDKNEAVPAPRPADNAQQEQRADAFETVATFDGAQVTGVTVAQDGRTFANFPRWRKDLPYSVVEIMADGSAKPYPNAEWNNYAGQPEQNKFTCVQSVVAHGGSLWVLDPSNPEMKGVVGVPTLYEFDLATNELKRKIEFGPELAGPRSYLNDLRIDEEHQKIYLTESGIGAIFVVDLSSGKARRVLADHPSTKTEAVTLYNKGKPFVKENGLPRRFQVDGIALNDGFLYYHSVTGRHLYRVATSVLANAKTKADRLSAAVEDLGETPLPDGMIFGADGKLFLADLENNAVVYRTADGKIEPFVKSENLQWADTFAIDPRGFLLFTDSKLNEVAPGQSAAGTKFPIYRVALPANR